MAPVPPDGDAARRRRRLNTSVNQSLRALSIQLALLHLRAGAHLDLRGIDIICLHLAADHGPLSPSALARRAGVHPATMTGVLDRLERGGWIARERDPADRRAVLVRVLPDRRGELIGRYAAMADAVEHICADYDEPTLEAFKDFLDRTAEAGDNAIHSV